MTAPTLFTAGLAAGLAAGSPPLFGGIGQGPRELVELLAAFVLTALIGLEREIQGKSAGLRTQTIVGTASALLFLVSKYGFSDVVADDLVVLDPSRVAAQIVSGVGFLGAGIIITRRGAVHGLTTAASVWESAAIGMAAGAGLLLLAALTTGLHFAIVFGSKPLAARIGKRPRGSMMLLITYTDGDGVLRRLLERCSRRNWQLTELNAEADKSRAGQVEVTMTLFGAGLMHATQELADIDGVLAVRQLDPEE